MTIGKYFVHEISVNIVKQFWDNFISSAENVTIVKNLFSMKYFFVTIGEQFWEFLEAQTM